jgi:hypothetical protein
MRLGGAASYGRGMAGDPRGVPTRCVTGPIVRAQ